MRGERGRRCLLVSLLEVEQVGTVGQARHSRAGALTGAALLALLAGSAFAQDPAAKSAPSQTAPAAAAPQVAMPEAETIVLLLRTTLLTLNDALQTGNFTVLRDIAAPGFRDVNSAARLSGIFGNLMRQGADLAPVAILTPQLSEPPTIDAKTSMLRIKGFFPGQPGRLDFEILYQAVRGHWRLFGIAVQPAAAQSEAAAAKDAHGTSPSPESASKFAPAKALTAPAKPADQPKAVPPKK